MKNKIKGNKSEFVIVYKKQMKYPPLLRIGESIVSIFIELIQQNYK